MTVMAALIIRYSLAGVMSGVLLVLALIHTLWAIGYWWPIRDERALVAAAVGVKTATRMPGPIPCALVAVALLSAAVWPWIMAGMVRHVGMVVAATVFLIRGILPWRPGWRRIYAQEPFATYDRRYYGPLCLALSLEFMVLFLQGV